MLQRPDQSTVLPTWKHLAASVSLGPEYDLGIDETPGNNSLMMALTQVFNIDRLIQHAEQSPEQQSIGEALEILVDKNPDICCAALETLDSITQTQNSNSTTSTISSLILSHIQDSILFSRESEIVSKAQTLLSNALTDPTRKASFFTNLSEQQTISMLSKLESQCLHGSPSNMQTALHLLAFVLDYAYQSHLNTHRRLIFQATARFIRILRLSIIDTNPFDTRLAAIRALCALSTLWTQNLVSKTTGPLLLGLSLVLYSLLNDDDDEIRALAASATATLLRAQGNEGFKDTVPLLSAEALAGWLATAFVDSPLTRVYLVREAMRRLTSPSFSPSSSPTTANTTTTQLELFTTPFSTSLASARYTDTSLFASEKQNLYLDETSEAVLWSGVLARQSALSVPTALYEGLVNWVVEGLEVLMRTAEEERDGALGWTSKSEVFALGMRVFCGAEVVLRWAGEKGKGLGVGVEREGVRTKILLALRRFVDIGYAADVHPLWLERVEQVLEKAVLRSLRTVKRGLVALEKNVTTH